MQETDLQTQHIFCNQMIQTFFLHVPKKIRLLYVMKVFIEAKINFVTIDLFPVLD